MGRDAYTLLEMCPCESLPYSLMLMCVRVCVCAKVRVGHREPVSDCPGVKLLWAHLHFCLLYGMTSVPLVSGSRRLCLIGVIDRPRWFSAAG